LRILGTYHLILFDTVHLIAVPEDERALSRAIGEARKRYSRRRNFAEGVRGVFISRAVWVVRIGREASGGGGQVGGE
jgi:hypothetical protein